MKTFPPAAEKTTFKSDILVLGNKNNLAQHAHPSYFAWIFKDAIAWEISDDTYCAWLASFPYINVSRFVDLGKPLK